jgi:hypothetical protein
MSSIKLGYVSCQALALCAACAGESTLHPARSAQRVPGLENAASASHAGVNVVAQSNAWHGDAQIEAVLTPLRVTIENRGARPVAIRYANLALVGEDGTRYTALTPRNIAGGAPALRDYVPVHRPGFEYYGYGYTPLHDPTYPPLFPYGRSVHYEPGFSHMAHERWTLVELPTEEMLIAALPEGDLAPGARVTGFVYFERITGDERVVTLRVDVPGIGSVALPFVVR